MTDLSPAPSPINPAEIKAIALKVKQRLSARKATGSTEAAERWANPLAPARGFRDRRLSVESTSSNSGSRCAEADGTSASACDMGAPRPTGSGNRLPTGIVCSASSSVRQTWSEEFDVDDGSTPAKHLSPRSRECTANLALAPVNTGEPSTTSEQNILSVGLGRGQTLIWTATPETTSVSEYPLRGKATVTLCNLQKSSLVLVPADAGEIPAAPRGPAAVNLSAATPQGSPTSASPPMESVRLSCESTDGAGHRIDWRDLPATVSVVSAGSPETICACAKIPVPGRTRSAYTLYTFRVQAGRHVLLIQTRYRQLRRLSRRLDSLLDLPILPPKVRKKSSRLSTAVVSQRQSAFREYIEAAVAAVVASRQAFHERKVPEPAASGARRFMMRRPKAKTNVPNVEAASAALQRFLTETAIAGHTTDAGVDSVRVGDSSDDVNNTSGHDIRNAVQSLILKFD